MEGIVAVAVAVAGVAAAAAGCFPVLVLGLVLWVLCLVLPLGQMSCLKAR